MEIIKLASELQLQGTFLKGITIYFKHKIEYLQMPIVYSCPGGINTFRN